MLFLLLAAMTAICVSGAARVNSIEAGSRLLHAFEENRGQAADDVRFVSRGRGFSLLLTADGPILKSSAATLRMSVSGGRTRPEISGEQPQSGVVNYYSRGRSISAVPRFGRVRYRGVYPGIDVVYHGAQNQIEYDFEVRPGSDPAQIALEFLADAFSGAKPRIEANGDLVLGFFVQRKPVAYQLIDGERRPVEAAYQLRGRRVAFRVSAYDRTKELIIDPIVTYSTYLGGSDEDVVNAIAVDPLGRAIVVGHTKSADFPLAAAADSTLHGQEAFVAKLSSDGTQLIYATFIGGPDFDTAVSVATDQNGNAYIALSSSSGIPTTPGAYRSTGPGPQLLKLGPTGQIVYCTFVGETMGIVRIRVDGTGNAHVVGTIATGQPGTAGALQPNPKGGYDGFVAKFNASATGVLYRTYIGGTGGDFPVDAALDTAGNLYVGGYTHSTDFPITPGAYQTANRDTAPTTNAEGFVAKINAAGTALVYSTYFGGGLSDFVQSIAVDAEGSVYILGSTRSLDLAPTPGTFAFRGALDLPRLFMAKFAPSGNTTTYRAIFSGAYALSRSLEVDAAGRAYAGVQFDSENPLPPTPGALLRPGLGSGVLILDPAGVALEYSSMITSGSSLVSGVVAFGSDGGIYVAGHVFGDGVPVSPLAYQTAPKAFQAPSSSDGFVTKLSTGCSFKAKPSMLLFASAGGTEVLSIDTQPECLWRAVAGGDGLTVIGATSGRGPGTLTLRSDPNISINPRLFSVDISGEAVGSARQNGACPHAVNARSIDVPDVGGPLTIKVNTTGLCTLEVASEADWIRTWIPATTYFTFEVLPNLSSTPRQGLVRIGDHVITVRQAGGSLSQSCHVAFSRPVTRLNAAGDPVTLGVSAPPHCAWKVTTKYVQVSPSSGMGDGVLTIGGNSGEVLIGNQVHRVIQASRPCSPTVTPVARSISKAGGLLTFAGDRLCDHETDVDWAYVYGPGSEFRVVVDRNTGPPRTARLYVGESVATISQEGVCAYTVQSSNTVAAAGGNLLQTVTTGAECAWTVKNELHWVAASMVNASGSATVTLTIARNHGAARSGSIWIAGTEVKVLQSASGCSMAFAAAPPPVTDAGGARGTLQVATTGAGCQWYTGTDGRWVQLYPVTGTASRPVEYTVFPNFTTFGRNAKLFAGGNPVSLFQSAATGSFNRRLVQFFYFAAFGRLPSPSELALQTAVLDTGALSPEAMLAAFLETPEFNLGGRFIAGLYVGLLTRDAEFGGWLFQRNAMAAGTVNPERLVTNFIDSAEFKLKFGTLSDAGFVRLMYRNILLREASDAEVQLQITNALQKGVTRAQLATAFLSSAEFRSRTGPRLAAFLIHALMLQRDGTSFEMADVAARSTAGTTIRKLAAEVLNSAEFRADVVD
jgi:hypothetical protein